MKCVLIGVTGKMGSGKSLFSYHLKKKGIPVYSSDERCRILMNKMSLIKKKIIKFFGKNSYTKEKKINKFFLSKILFNNYDALKLLSSIIHPWIKIDFKKWMIAIVNSNIDKKRFYLIKESALLFESGSYKDCDMIINLSSPLKNKIERIIKRDNLNEIEIINRLKNQISNKMREKASDILVNNNCSRQYLEEKSHVIHEKIIKKIEKYGKRR
ncbi:dephospho-CoA kinase [Blattabacterium cuenoti]|uniref:dephospho-CoA kinase n=1 Tax=Blattabacterium cuenoti TaxID=1653831 RepID=UPI00163B76D2|nr:dephospho-CoA kinase [Blattabacterium cuenoti]